MRIKTLGVKLESNNHVIFVVFFPLIFENDGSLTTNDEEIIIVFVQNLILSKKNFNLFCWFFWWERNSCFSIKDFIFILL
jgi:hypothetical protein